MYTLDTNAIIYYLAGDPEAGTLMDGYFQKNVSLYISTITIAELFSGKKMDTKEEDLIENILYSLFSVPVDVMLARMGGDLRRTYRLKLADSIIAATALSTDTTLVTRNVVDFQRIGGLKIQQV